MSINYRVFAQAQNQILIPFSQVGGGTGIVLTGPYDSQSLSFSLPDNWQLLNGTALEFYVEVFIASNQSAPLEGEVGASLNVYFNRRLQESISLIVGEVKSGKTSLLLFLTEPNNEKKLFGEEATRLIFFYADPLSWQDDLSQARFWELAFEPFFKTISKEGKYSRLLKTYNKCFESGFSTFTLEQIFAQMQKEEWHLVIMLDEFDTLIQHPVLNRTEFYGSLRTLASRYGNALTLVIASRQSLSVLNNRTQEYNRTGSPFFNFISEIPLYPFSRAHSIEILKQAGRRFKRNEKELILYLAGGHPHLLQIGGSALWDVYEAGNSPSERLIAVGNQLLNAATSVFSEIWRNWAPETQRVFTIIALDEMPKMLDEREFDLKSLLATLPNYPRQIRYLKEYGFIMVDKDLTSGWQVSAKVMLWWLAEELLIALQKDDELGQFLSANQWDGLFTKGEKKQFTAAISGLGNIAKTGAEAFIKTTAEGFGKGISAKY